MKRGLLYTIILLTSGCLSLWSGENSVSFELGFSLLSPDSWYYRIGELSPEMTFGEFELLSETLSPLTPLTGIILYNYNFNEEQPSGEIRYLKKFPLRVYNKQNRAMEEFLNLFMEEQKSRRSEPIPIKEISTGKVSELKHPVYLCHILYSSNVSLLKAFIEGPQFILEFTQYIEHNRSIPEEKLSSPYLAPFSLDEDLKSIINSLSFHDAAPTLYFTPTVARLRMRSLPSLQGTFLRYLASGEILRILEVGKEDFIAGLKGNWVKVRTEDGDEGWCFNGYLKELK